MSLSIRLLFSLRRERGKILILGKGRFKIFLMIFFSFLGDEFDDHTYYLSMAGLFLVLVKDFFSSCSRTFLEGNISTEDSICCFVGASSLEDGFHRRNFFW